MKAREIITWIIAALLLLAGAIEAGAFSPPPEDVGTFCAARSGKVRHRQHCRPSESPVGVDEIRLCKSRSGGVSLKAPQCRRTEERLGAFVVRPTDGGVDGRSCGGFSPNPGTCAAGEYCHTAPTQCRWIPDAPGVCRSIPRNCVRTVIYDPVCGCDGHTYTNAGAAHCAGVSIASEGPCIIID